MMQKIALMISMILASSDYAISEIDEEKTGAWYMPFFDGRFQESKLVFQGDIQYRKWDLMGDLGQSLLRGGVDQCQEEGPIRFLIRPSTVSVIAQAG